MTQCLHLRRQMQTQQHLHQLLMNRRRRRMDMDSPQYWNRQQTLVRLSLTHRLLNCYYYQRRRLIRRKNQWGLMIRLSRHTHHQRRLSSNLWRI